MRSTARTLEAVLALLGVCAAPCVGQTTFAAVVGSIRDASGAVVPGVSVTIQNEANGETDSRETNRLGAYAFTTLIPGQYRIRAELSGFQTVDVRNIELQVNQTARFDLAMELGRVEQTVEVVAAKSLLATESSDVGQVINNEQIVDLPLNGRYFMQLSALTNGVVLSGNTESGGPNILSDGGRVTANSFLVEGVESRTQREGGYGADLSVDAIGEFRILQNSFSAEFGRGSTIVNATIKSGGNRLHGSVLEFFRNDRLDARNAFDLTNEVPKLRLNQFGGSVGGPIRKNRLFFFTNYEGQRTRRGGTYYANVPPRERLEGDLGKATADPLSKLPFPTNRIPADRISQFARAAARYYPPPTPYNLPRNNYATVLTNPATMNQGTGRIDYVLGSNDRLSSNLTSFRSERATFGAMPSTGRLWQSNVKPRLAGEHTHIFSPRLLNNFRFGYSWTDTYTGPPVLLDHDASREFGLSNLSPEPAAWGIPYIAIDSYTAMGTTKWIPNGATDVNRQLVEQVTLLKGAHSLKFGADLRFFRYDDLGYATQLGSYTFTNRMYTKNGLADFLLGWPQEAFVNQAGGKGFSERTRNGEYSFYVQGDFKLARSLTLNAGLRYEFVRWPLEINDEQASWNFQKGSLDYAGNDLPRRMVKPDRNNWGPRLGLAYTPTRKTVIRAGAGVMYGNFRQWEISLLHFNFPFVIDNFAFNELPLPKYTTANLWPRAPTSPEQVDFKEITVNYQSPDKVAPVTYQWNLSIQRQLQRSLLLEIAYVGNRGVRLPNRWDANPASQDVDLAHPTPIQSRRQYQNVGFVSGNTSRAWSNYNALKARLERRWSSGFSVLGTYTWGKAMGIRLLDNFTVMDINDMRKNYGPVNDFTHRANISYTYALPFGKALWAGAPAAVRRAISGWQVNGIWSIQSGAALSMVSTVSNNRGNRAGNYPDRLRDGNLPWDQRSAARWYDVSAFRDPALGAYGNSGEGVIRGPGAVNQDLSLFRNVAITERQRLQLRLEAFNALNHVNLGNPGVSLAGAGRGTITSAATAREVQIGLKYLF